MVVETIVDWVLFQKKAGVEDMEFSGVLNK